MHSNCMNGRQAGNWCACQISPHGGSVVFLIRLAALYVFEYNVVWPLCCKYSKLFVYVQTGRCGFCELFMSHSYIGHVRRVQFVNVLYFDKTAM